MSLKNQEQKFLLLEIESILKVVNKRRWKILNEKDFLFFVQCLDIGEAWEEAEVDQGQASSFQANCSKSIPRPKGIQTYSKTIQKIFK